MEKSTLYAFGIFLIILAAGYIFLIPTSPTVAQNSVADNALPGEVQRVLISEKDFNYYPSEIKVKANQPVSISLDDSVYGCLRAFTIKDFGLSKVFKTSEDTLDFTPTKKGTYGFACSMGMGYGKIVVE